MEIVMEKAAPADAAALLDFLKQVGGETDNLTFGAEGLPISVEAETAFLARQASSLDDIMLVAKADGKIIGNASVSRFPRRMHHRGEVGVSVAKAYWNQGIGRMLMEGLISFARSVGMEILELQVRSDNLRAIRLYEKLGFQKNGTHPAFFQIEGEDISFDYMVLRLK